MPTPKKVSLHSENKKDKVIDFKDLLSAFVVLFALIDVLGSVPVFLNFKKGGQDVNPIQASLYSFCILVAFLFVGDWILKLFNV
ncbi:MAG: hypothetical protein RL662_337, partial [Bacteroidota bacterium]